jgi:hypothetical protein
MSIPPVGDLRFFAERPATFNGEFRNSFFLIVGTVAWFAIGAVFDRACDCQCLAECENGLTQSFKAFIMIEFSLICM